ncbi:hypothetical protein GRI89_16795 [Altererythrobacter salegens]|uniref:Lipoprotein n=1 Tax=Croceibacterium salegens TaxID=1737568 RepID=A0A6I4SYK8_9SPHN|nr:hypothetical protein [Croceibacterium salegens]MXO61204.1 hypothetical protein [Croceibacterium salegens]
MIRIALLAPMGLLAACTTAEMKMPSNLADAGGERISFENMSVWNKGRFLAGSYSGGYERTLDRLSLFDLFKQDSGRASFTIAGPGISSTIEGHCRVRERALTLDSLEFKPGKMAYRCDLEAEGQPIPARFEVQESRKGLAENLTRNARRGEIALAGDIVSFRSVHDVAGTVLPVENPIGYVFEQDGKAIGALQLNGKPILTMPSGTEIGQRRAMMVASVALATFWDPAST